MITIEPIKKENEISKSLRRQIAQNEQKYKLVAQIALYSQLKQMEDMGIFTKSTPDVELNLIFSFDGSLFNSKRKEEILYFLIRTFMQEVPKLKNQYSLAYIYHSMNDYKFFKSVLHYLRQEHFLKLKSVYVIGMGTMGKVYHRVSFGAINEFIYDRTHYLERVQDIEGLNKVTLGGNVAKSKIKMLEEVKTDSGVVGVKVIQNQIYGKCISAYPLSIHGIPTIMENLIIKLYSNQKYLEAQGVMRKSCDVEQLDILQQYLIEGTNSESYLRDLDDPYVVCGCLKKIFNNLYVPLFAYDIYESIAGYRPTGREEDDIEFAYKCVNRMDELNQRVLVFLIGFLRQGIVSFKDKNKMSAYNLAVVFGPCLFRPMEYKLQDYMNSGKCSKIILLLLDYFERIVGEQRTLEVLNLLETMRKQYKTTE